MGIKNFLLNAFRELIVHNHGSLDFRAKLFALLVAVNEHVKEEVYDSIKEAGLDIYNNDEERADLLVLSTREIVTKVKEDHGTYIDTLLSNIQHELKLVPRYAQKIDTEALKKVLELTKDEDTLLYQENILEFLDTLKEETIYSKKSQIKEDEQKIYSKYRPYRDN